MASVPMPGIPEGRPARVRKACAAPAFAWGNNQTGELGQGNEKDSAIPLSIARLDGPIAAISSGTDGSLALIRRGRVWSWGGNDQGQLGTGDQQSHDAPVMVRNPGGYGRLSGITAVVSANVASAALNAHGGVFTWGNNIWGQLGDGTLNGPEHCPTFMSEPPSERDACSKLPVPVGAATGQGTLSRVVAIAATNDNDLALRSDGTVWSWEVDDLGQLGNGKSEEFGHPPSELVGPDGRGHLQNVVSISAGGGFSMARLTNGSIWTWGQNDSGQLGIGNHTGSSKCTTAQTGCSLAPVQVTGPEGTGTFSGSVQISAGQLHATALQAPDPGAQAGGPVPAAWARHCPRAPTARWSGGEPASSALAVGLMSRATFSPTRKQIVRN
jgi:alpha-tubulin suppressor-like RCC1 family protein